MRCPNLAGVLILVSMTGGCAMLWARKEPSPPPLEVPVVPPRTITPQPSAEPELETDLPPGGNEAQTPTREPSPDPARPVRRGADEPAQTAKDGAKGSQERIEPGQRPALRLGSRQTGGTTKTARGIRETLTRVARSLGRVDVAELSEGARAQYDTAERFIERAEAALKTQNLVFARYLADKVETLARELEPAR